MLRGSLLSHRLFLAITFGALSWLCAGTALLAETLTGTVTAYDPRTKEATIDIGSNAGLGTGDSGAISLSGLAGSRGVRNALIAVVRVTPDSAVVEVRESEPVSGAIVSGLPVTVSTGSTGASLPSRDRAAESPTGAELPSNPRTESPVARSLQCPPQSAPDLSASELPADYIEAYAAALTQPSPRTHYTFAQTLIDYELAEEALLWLEEAERCFPETQAVNRLYRTVALVQLERLPEAERALEAAADRFAGDPIFTEIRGYLLTQQGQWEDAIALVADEPSEVNASNHLIAQYCSKPPKLDRKSEIPPMPCSFGNALGTDEPSKDGRKELEELVEKIGENPVESAQLLNTLGFVALQLENYDLAHQYYLQLIDLVESRDFASPSLVALKENADIYIQNYDQNYDFLAQKEQDLDSLRSQNRTLTALSAVTGVAGIATRVGGSRSTGGLIGGGVVALARTLGTNREAKRLKKERLALLDNVRQTFSENMTLAPARPALDPEPLLASSDRRASGAALDNQRSQ